MKLVRLTTLFAVWTCFGIWTAFASAQGRTTTTGTAGVTQPTVGATGNTGATGATAANALGGGAGGAGGAGAAGGTAPAMSTANQPTFNAADGSIGAQIGQGGFAGRANTGFAGNRLATQNGNTSLPPQFNQMNNSSNQNPRGNTGKANVVRARPVQRIAFTYPKANLAANVVKLNSRFERLTGIGNVDTKISDEGVATLTGTVTSEDNRKLAEIFTRQEPGVRSVVNELQVETTLP